MVIVKDIDVEWRSDGKGQYQCDSEGDADSDRVGVTVGVDFCNGRGRMLVMGVVRGKKVVVVVTGKSNIDIECRSDGEGDEQGDSEGDSDTV